MFRIPEKRRVLPFFALPDFPAKKKARAASSRFLSLGQPMMSPTSFKIYIGR